MKCNHLLVIDFCQPFRNSTHQYHHQLSSLDLSLRNESENINTSTINANFTRTASNPTTAFNYSQTSFINSDSRLDPIDLNSRPQREHQFDLINQDRAMRYYSPLIESTLIPLPSSSPISYLSLNQKRESVITFNHNQLVANNFNDRSNRSSKHLYSSVVDDDGERDESIGTELDENEFNDDGIVSKTDKDLNRHHQQQQQRNQSDKNLDHNDFKTKLSSTTATPSTPTTISVSSKSSSNKTNPSDDEIRNDEIVLVQNIRLTIDQIICICQILQKSDLKKLEKFVVAIPNSNDVCNRNELILRAKAIAAYHGGNFKQVYHLLEANSFPIKFHQELQSLWNNAHYKEHEMKRGHPPGAVEKYRIRKKYRFPRTIWDGEEYVYCFKEKNRRILKEFYQKCNLPTQEDKLKLSNETQLTVVQSKY
ncbi:homeobox protein SIX4 [Sarcoptes scabiei]|nr:homeobox protein SIX4 [Sarcoptes scabiei]